MRTWASKSAALLALCLLLSGCGERLLERSYSSVTPHSAVYRVSDEDDTLRAENYQELVNILLMLLSEHREDGVVRIYGDNAAALAEAACVEVQKETPVGAYLLDYITYDAKAESGYYELTARFGYRRTAEEQAAIVNATSTEALPALLRAAVEEGREAVAIRFGYMGTDRQGVLDLTQQVHDEFYPPTAPETEEAEAPAEPETEGAEAPAEPDLRPWRLLFYPDGEHPGIIEVILGGEEEPAEEAVESGAPEEEKTESDKETERSTQ